MWLKQSDVEKHLSLGFPRGSEACNVWDPGSIPASGRYPGEGNGNPVQYSCLENLHGLRSLGGCSPWGSKESDTTERLHFYFPPWKSRNLLSASSSSSPSGIQDFLWTYLNINSLADYLSLVVEPQVKISRDLSWDPRVKQT